MTIFPDFRKTGKCYARYTPRIEESVKKKAEILDLKAQGYSRNEIAELLGINVNALGKRCMKYGIRWK